MTSLKTYNEKRDFTKTPEPPGTNKAHQHSSRFVMQKHQARQTHYDFRLQVGEVLVSWAIPKSPVMDPDIKRLAVKTEDHPLAYFHFEGSIPKGNYGAGKVIVWDTGSYRPIGLDEENPEAIKDKIEKGSLKFFLEGEKLKGHFTLYQIKNKKDNSLWNFAKTADEYADKNHEFGDQSVLTGRTLGDIENQKSPKPLSNPSSAEGAKKTTFPNIKPMLAKLGDKVFDNPEWIYEIKLDGYRIMATRHKNEYKLVSRNGNLYNDNYPPILEELSGLTHDFIIDGEVVVLNKEGKSDFGALQNLDHHTMPHLRYYAFDLLWLDGYSLIQIPLIERKALLKSLLPDTLDRILYLDHIEERGEAFFDKASQTGLEGIIAKRKSSKYYPGKRSDEWLKLKTKNRQEVVIVGYTDPAGSRKYFGSLLTAVMQNGKLRYAGKVGTGFKESELKKIYHEMTPLARDSAPLQTEQKNVHWIEPKLLAEVQFGEWTKTQMMRHPVFMGLRTDKKPKEIHHEKPQVNTRSINRTIRLSNPEKIFWPDKKITKKDVFDYYSDIAPYILPYLYNRPQSLYRTPDGIKGSGFFQKNANDIAPQWMETTRVESHSSDDSTRYLLCQDKQSLLYLVNLGCIEFNPWNSSLPRLDHPDYIVFDLDPVEVAFEKVVEVALGFKEIFDALDLPFYCKTSGSRGLHIYLPVLKKYSHDQARQFARLIQTLVHHRHKKITSFERSPSKRQGRIYLDYLQNGYGKTMASVYCLRPKAAAAVSTPLKVEELTSNLKPEQFNIFTMRERLQNQGDLWEGFFEQAIDLQKTLKQLNKLPE